MPTRPTADHAGPTYHVVNRATVRPAALRGLRRVPCLRPPDGVGAGPSPIELFAFCLMPNHCASAAADARGPDMSAFMHRLTMTHALRTAWLARHTRPRRRLPEPIRASLVAQRFVFLPGRPLRRAQSGQCQVRGTRRGLDVVERVAGRDAPGCQARAMAAPATTGLAGLRQRRGAAARAGLHETPRPAPRTLRRSEPPSVEAACQQSEEDRGCL